ncbi:MAG: AAA family ATPase [Candidatus Binatia bacterium]
MTERNDSFSAIVHALSQTDCYPHHPARIEVRQTHISWIFLSDPFVYKIKKPVRFDFLDYSTLDKRRHFCGEEMRLNQRLAPNVYLNVVPILEHQGNFVVGDGLAIPRDGRIVEHAVKMRRLPDDKMLDRLVRRGNVGTETITRLARKLVSFHQKAATERASLYGPAAVWQNWAENFRETESFVDRVISAQQYDAIRDFAGRFFSEHKFLFETRVREGRVCEGHGDLRAEHVCVTDDIVVFDCIEFNEGFRYGDVTSEVAFLAMDLDFLGEPALGDQLVTTYEDLSQDPALFRLLPFYKCYRAYVRGKVECLKSQEREVPELERNTARTRARRHYALAYRYARGTPAPALIIVCGLTATGKSTVAEIIRDRTGFVLLSSDVVRKRLAGLEPTERAAAGLREGIYSDEFTELTYRTIASRVEGCLKERQGAIVDATFKDAKHRRLFIEVAERLGVRVIFVECRTEEKEILRRLDQRQEAGSVSDATREVYLRLRDEFLPLNEIPSEYRLMVRTDADPNEFLSRLESLLIVPHDRSRT